MTQTSAFDLDTVIVGAGPAGLCAGMYAGRGMLKAVVLESRVPGGELLNTEKIEDYPGFESILGRELAERMTAHAKKFGAEIRQATVDGIFRQPDGTFEVKTLDGDAYRAPTVILTAGGTPTKLEVPGEAEYAGFGVSYCAVCDGAFFRNQTIAVIGGGDAAVEEADYLTRYAAKVYLVHRRSELRASKVLQERLFANPKIEPVWNKQVLEVEGREQAGLREVTALRLKDTVTGAESRLAASGCFVFIGFRPNSGLIREHFRHDASGYVITDDRMMTSIPGLFAAGDLRVQLTRQVTTAVGDATTAAIAVEKYLTERRAKASVGA
ncbi:MAG: thioredoxin-disulfide reductase [Gemmatimonadetes bacterium]|nr:thioredoxin-disulfide reductase [Gemmatimonadota bacterium]MBK7716189.1 thioredoxin-disulfide reductase [Gemmatimonadota bacterium]